MRRTVAVLVFYVAATLAPGGCASDSSSGTSATPAPTPASAPDVQQSDPFAAIPRVSVEELAKALKEGRAVAVDVRPAEAFEEEHIAGAYSIPEEEVRERAAELPPGKLVVAYCA